MVKADLKKSSGLNIVYNGEGLEFTDIDYLSALDISVDLIRPHLLNRELTCPDIFYTKYFEIDKDGIYKKKKLKVNFSVVKPNLAGIEFVKTRSTRSEKYPRILEIVYGGGILLMQKFENKFESDIISINIKKNMKIVVPAGYDVVMVNTRQVGALIVEEIASVKANIKTTLDDMHGMAYYVIRKNAKQEVVRNPEYRAASEIRKVNWDKVLSDIKITGKTPLIKQILRKYDKFDWLFKENSFNLN